MTEPRIISIAGGSGSGKSRLARLLHATLAPHATTLTLDHFYQDLAHLPPAERDLTNFDDPASIDWESAEEAVTRLAAGESAEIPRYDFVTHTRAEERDLLAPAPVVILEGLWSLTRPVIRRFSTLTIFVDCSAELRLSRRIERDTRERGRSGESVRQQFEQHVAPMHDLHVQPQASLADLVLYSPIGDQVFAGLLHHPALMEP